MRSVLQPLGLSLLVVGATWLGCVQATLPMRVAVSNGLRACPRAWSDAPTPANLFLRPDDFVRRHPELYRTTAEPRTAVRLPAEYEPVDRVYLAWWPGRYDQVFRDLVAAVLRYGRATPVVLHHGAVERKAIRTFLDPVDRGRRVVYLDVAGLGPYHRAQARDPARRLSPRSDWDVRAVQSAWVRDWGPFFVHQAGGRLAVVDPVYQGKRINDDAVPSKLARHHRLPVHRPPLEIDGGNLLTDGQGTCFAALEDEDEVRASFDPAYLRVLDRYFGCRQLVRLEPLSGERTGHVDVFLQVAPGNTLLLGRYDRQVDGHNADLLDRNLGRLQRARDTKGRSYRVLRVDMPDHFGAVYRTHLNAVVVNQLVVVPTFLYDRRAERQALAVFRRAFPGRRVVRVVADDVMAEGGALHCVTRTRPVRPRRRSRRLARSPGAR